MPTVVILPRVEVQIVDVLEHTLEEFGEAKYLEYRELIGLALKTLELARAEFTDPVLMRGPPPRPGTPDGRGSHRRRRRADPAPSVAQQ